MASASETPYISVVVAARNDNHGGNMLGRMQAFLDSWLVQARRYDLRSEIIVVEWNPPQGRPRLQDALEWPDSAGPCAVRFIEVSREVHSSTANSIGIPLHQMIAKNVGIRRARGEFVLATNLDIIFPAELMQFLAERRLDQDVFYRADRFDVASEIPPRTDVHELLQFCHTHILRVCAREGTYETPGPFVRPVEPRDVLAPDCGIRLGAGWYGTEIYGDYPPLRYLAPDAEIVFERPSSGAYRMILDVEVGPSARDGWVQLDIVDADGRELAAAVVDGRSKLRLHIPHELTSGRFGLRTRHGGVPLLNDPRLLDLRVFDIRWADRTWLESLKAQPKDEGSQVATKDCQSTVAPVEGFELERFDVTLTDGAGNIVSLWADPAELVGFSNATDYQIKCELGFRSAVEDSKRAVVAGYRAGSAATANSQWKIDVIGRRPAMEWANQAPTPYAAFMRNPAYLHTNACGDFTLLSRENWFRLRGYPEFPIWPAHVDALLCYTAHHAGIREILLNGPMRVYHVQHFSGAGWTPEGEEELNARVAAKGVPTLAYAEVLKHINLMRRFDVPLIFSKSDWGLARFELPETSPPAGKV